MRKLVGANNGQNPFNIYIINLNTKIYLIKQLGGNNIDGRQITIICKIKYYIKA